MSTAPTGGNIIGLEGDEGESEEEKQRKEREREQEAKVLAHIQKMSPGYQPPPATPAGKRRLNRAQGVSLGPPGKRVQIHQIGL